MQVALKTLLDTDRDLVDLANSALPAKAKYWVGRIAEAVKRAQAEYDKVRGQKVIELGEPVRYEPVPPKVEDGKEIPQDPRRIVITDPEEAKKPTTMFEVKEENLEAFHAWNDDLLSQEVEILFNRIKLSMFCDTVTRANLSALAWMIDDEGLVG